jgi:hypothetical protein
MVRGVAIVRDRMNTSGVSDHTIWTDVKVKRNVKEAYSFTSKLRYVHKISRQLLPYYTAVSYVKIVMYKYTYWQLLLRPLKMRVWVML